MDAAGKALLDRYPVEQLAQPVLVLRGKGGEEVLLVLGRDLHDSSHSGTALLRQVQRMAAAIRGISSAHEQPS